MVKTIEKEKQWLNTLFSWKVCTGTKPKPNLKTLYNGTSPVHLCLTFTWTCVFCFSLSLKYFGFLYDVFIVHFFAHFFLSSQPTSTSTSTLFHKTIGYNRLARKIAESFCLPRLATDVTSISVNLQKQTIYCDIKWVMFTADYISRSLKQFTLER